MAADNCLNVTASWSPNNGPCSYSVQYMIALMTSDNGTIEQLVTNNTIYSFNSAVNLTGNISVTVVAFNANSMGSYLQVNAQPSQASKEYKLCA